MELNREQIIKALECCVTTSEGDCIKCGYRGKKRSTFITCTNCLISDALALINSQEQKIKELTEENERLKKRCTDIIQDYHDVAREYGLYKRAHCNPEFFKAKELIEEAKADTLQKYKSAIIEYYSKPKYQPTKGHPIKHTQIEHLFAVLDQIAKEMVEGE